MDLGQVFTNKLVAEYMTSLFSLKPSAAVLDPCFGDGVFLSALKENNFSNIGISLIVSSQRPSELSKTVLSQCNSFIIHRLQNPDDQKYVRGLISSANADLLEQLPIIPQQHAIITGDCVRTPVQVKIDDVFPTPNSHNPKYISNWLKDSSIPYSEICNRWIRQNKSEVKS